MVDGEKSVISLFNYFRQVKGCEPKLSFSLFRVGCPPPAISLENFSHLYTLLTIYLSHMIMCL